MATLTLSIETKDKSSNIIKGISNSFAEMSEKIGKAVKESKENSGGFMKSLGGIATATMGLKIVIDIFQKIEKTFKEAGGETSKTFQELQNIFNQLTNILTNIFIPIFNEIIKGIKNFIKSSEGINIISNIFGGLSATISILKETFTVLFDIIKNSIIKSFESLKEKIGNMNNENNNLVMGLNVLKGALLVISIAMNVTINIIKTLINLFFDLANTAKEIGGLLFNIFTGKWDKVAESANNVLKAFNNLSGNLVDNFKEIIDGAIKTAEEVNNKFNIDKIMKNATDNFKKTQKEVKKTLEKNTEDLIENNKKIEDESLIFTEELKKIYLEYISEKEKIKNKELLTEQQYFDSLEKIRQLEKIKGIRELEEYYKKSQEIIKNNTLSIIDQVVFYFEKIDISKYFAEINDKIAMTLTNINKNLYTATNNTINIIKNVFDNIKNINESNLSNLEKNKEKIKVIMSGVLQGLSSILTSVGNILNNVFSNVNDKIEKEINEIENKYKKIFKEIDNQREKDLKLLEKETQEKLKVIGMANKTELEMAIEKLNELKEARQSYKDAEIEMRLEELNNYYNSLEEKNDIDIKNAYESKKRLLEEQENKKILMQEEAIKKQELEVKKLQILADAEAKKTAIIEESEKKRAEAEKKRLAEMDQKEKEAFEANKINQIANIWISTATGIAMAWATAMQSGPIAGMILAAIATTALLAVAGAQTAIIASQQYTPKNYATGGVIVGETGPELLQVPKGTRIYNNDQTNQILNNQEIVLVNNIYIDSEQISNILIRKRLNLNLKGSL